MTVIYNMVVYDDMGRERLRGFEGRAEPEEVFSTEMMTVYEVRFRFSLANIDNIRRTMEEKDDNKM